MAKRADDLSGIWVFIETETGHGLDVGYEIMNPARGAAFQTRCRLIALVMGSGVENVAWESIRYGADAAILVDGEEFRDYDGEVFSDAILRLDQLYAPQMLLIGETPLGVDLAKRLSQKLGVEIILQYDALHLVSDRKAPRKGSAFPRRLPEAKPWLGLISPGDFRKGPYNAALMSDVIKGMEELGDEAK